VALRLEPRSVEANLALGFAHLKLDDPARALPYLTTAAALDPLHPDVCFALGLAYVALGRRDLAAAQYDRLLSLDPNLAPRLGQALGDAG
jgi:tetratricopeptide (TPR) repeat protein